MTEFSELGLSPATLQAVADTGYTTATPIQAEAIPHALTGRDVLGIAQTGTGKTAAFTLPMIDRLKAGRSKARMPRALVIAPTRELADQVAASFEKYAKGQKLSWALLIGGVSFSDQELKLDRGVDVVIATPGRLLDHFERGKLLMTGVQIMVVDEADRMLDMGFIPDLERIFKLTPPRKQTLFFSATMPPEITRITKQFLKDPIRVEASRPATTADTITQYLLRIPTTDQKAKRTALRTLIARDDVQNGIVFCNRKSEVDIVAKSLKTHGFDAAPIHGDLDQSTRMRTLESFRNGSLKLLVASDVAARGLDIPAVSHVFNYDVPHHADDYVHRIGRTGRAGRLGEAFMITTPADARNLDKVLKLTGKMPEEITLDLEWDKLKDEPRSGRGDRSGGRGGRGERSSGRRGEGRGPRGADRHHGETAPMEPVVPTPAAPAAVKADAETPVATTETAPRGRHRRGPRAERAATPAEAPQVEAAKPDAPAAEERAAPEPRRERRSEREIPQRELVKREQPPRESRDRDRGRGGDRNRRGQDGDRDNDRDGVVGFGADVPAFLMRAPPPRPAED
jgi:superfamily II DNA/RNA helicase